MIKKSDYHDLNSTPNNGNMPDGLWNYFVLKVANDTGEWLDATG
jgi:hypothetical protein